ncbi:type IV secretion system toxin Tse4, partial [Salmonella enterica]
VNLNVKGKSVGGAGALEALPSTGTVLVADGLVGRDLSRGDFTGPCMYVELGAGVIAGGSGTAILFGLDPKLL